MSDHYDDFGRDDFNDFEEGEVFNDREGEGDEFFEEDFDLDDGEYPDDIGVRFADPGGRSSLRAATARDPRDQSCPTCEAANRLTRKDVALGYQCDRCADRAESGCD